MTFASFRSSNGRAQGAVGDRRDSADFPVTSGALQTTYQGGPYGGEGFVTEFATLGLPEVASLSANSAAAGTQVVINGSGFGSTQGSSTVTFNGIVAVVANSGWTNSQITVIVPTGASSGSLVVTVGGQSSNPVGFLVGTPPTITASVSPTPNALGWNTTNALVSFNCVPGSSQITSCAAPILVTTQGQNQHIVGTVTDSAGFSVTATATVSVETIRPTLTVTAPIDQSTVSSSAVTVSGTVANSLTAVTGVTCNASAASLSGGAFSCNISLNPGVNLLMVNATDAAGLMAGTRLHVIYPATLPAPVLLRVTPGNANLLIGGTQQFTAVDEFGRPRSDATWTVTDTSIATISTDSSPMVTGETAGQVTLTATIGNATAQSQITVLAATSFPVGTPLWTASYIPGFSAESLFQAVPTPNGPSLYSLETGPSGAIYGVSMIIRAFTADGQQLWQQSLGLQGIGTSVVPDGFGGIAVQSAPVDPSTGTQQPSFLMDLDGQTGSTVWQHNFPLTGQGALPGTAIRPNGDLVAVIPVGSYPFTESLAVLDGNTGQLATIPLQHSVAIGCGVPAGTGQVVLPGPVSSDSNGAIYMEYFAIDQFTAACADGFETDTWQTSLRLLTMSPDGSRSEQILKSDTYVAPGNTYATPASIPTTGSTPIPGRAIPDGQGGVLAFWTDTPALSSTSLPIMVTHISSTGGSSYELPDLTVLPGLTSPNLILPGSDIGGRGAIPIGSLSTQVVLGENGTSFATDGTNIISFATNSGAANWSYQASGGLQVNILSSAARNALVAKTSDTNGVDTVVRIDSTGNAVSDAWTSSRIQYLGYGTFVGLQSSIPTAILAAPFNWGSVIWPTPSGDPQNQQVSPRFDFELVWCQGGRCSSLLKDTYKDVPFTYYQNYPRQVGPTIQLTPAQQTVVINAAWTALKTAYANYNVTVGQSSQGSNTAYIVGDDLSPCGDTGPLSFHTSRIYYLANMRNAQTDLLVQSPSPTNALLSEIGTGIGANAAHEIAHQLSNHALNNGQAIPGLDDDAPGTYNGGSCNDPAVFTGFGADGQTAIYWQSNTAQALTTVLGDKH